MFKKKRASKSLEVITLLWQKNLAITAKKEKGTILLVSILTGLLMIGVVSLAIAKANQNKTNSISELSTKQAFTIAEGAASRYMAFLARFPEIAVYCHNVQDAYGNTINSTQFPSCHTGTTWLTPTSTTKPCGATVTASDYTSWASDAWQTFEGSSEFRLISYTYTPDGADNTAPGTGTLTIEGRTSSNSFNSGTTQLEFKIRITDSTEGCPIPGVWVPSGGTVKVSPHGDGSVNAVVKQSGSTTNTVNPFGGDFPGGSLNGAQIYNGADTSVGEINMAMPGIPASVPTAASSTSGAMVYEISTPGEGFLKLVAPCTIRLPRKVGDNAWGSGGECDAIKPAFNGITSGNEDKPHTADGNYYYVIPAKDGNSNNDSLYVNTAGLLIEPEAGAKVIIYVEGKVYANGTQADDSDMVVYTSDDTNSDGIPDYVPNLGGVNTTKFIALENLHGRDPDPDDLVGYGCEMVATDDPSGVVGSKKLKGFINQGSPKNLEMYGSTSGDIDISNGKISAFMLFPNAMVKVSQGIINGVAWAGNFDDFSNTSGCTVGMVQNDVGDVLAATTSEPRNQINAISSMKRRAVGP